MKIIRLIIIFSVVIVSFTGGGVVAEQPETVTIECNGDNIDHNVQKTIDLYNSNTDKIPDIIKPVLSANTTEFSIHNTSVTNYTVKTNSDLNITEIDTQKPDSPDVLVQTDKGVACDISNSNDPVKAFQDAYDNGDINIEGNGVVNKAKVYVIELVNSFL